MFKSIVAAALLAGTMLLSACGGEAGASAAAVTGPSDSVINDTLKGSTHFMVGHGFAHSGMLKTERASDIERGNQMESNGTAVFPIRAKLSGGGKEGQFTFYFYQNEFGDWVAEKKD